MARLITNRFLQVLPSYEDVIRASVNRTAPLIDIQVRFERTLSDKSPAV